MRIRRISVSAEAYERHNAIRPTFIPKTFKKSEEQKSRIRKQLNSIFVFSSLSKKDKFTVIEAMEEHRVKRGEYVIHQGENGSHLYIVDYGHLDCLKKFQSGQSEKFIRTYDQGDSFGELALLHNTCRGASIKSKTDCVLWKLDRRTFNLIVKESAMRDRKKHESFLSSIKILQDMDHNERVKIADALCPLYFESGEYVIRQGEDGDSFYIIVSGTAIALKAMNIDEEPIEVYQFNSGDYFGELALLRNQKRSASIKATSALEVVSLNRESFKNLCGPLEDILKRNMERYSNYMNN